MWIQIVCANCAEAFSFRLRCAV